LLRGDALLPDVGRVAGATRAARWGRAVGPVTLGAEDGAKGITGEGNRRGGRRGMRRELLPAHAIRDMERGNRGAMHLEGVGGR